MNATVSGVEVTASEARDYVQKAIGDSDRLAAIWEKRARAAKSRSVTQAEYVEMMEQAKRESAVLRWLLERAL